MTPYIEARLRAGIQNYVDSGNSDPVTVRDLFGSDWTRLPPAHPLHAWGLDAEEGAQGHLSRGAARWAQCRKQHDLQCFGLRYGTYVKSPTGFTNSRINPVSIARLVIAPAAAALCTNPH